MQSSFALKVKNSGWIWRRRPDDTQLFSRHALGTDARRIDLDLATLPRRSVQIQRIRQARQHGTLFSPSLVRRVKAKHLFFGRCEQSPRPCKLGTSRVSRFGELLACCGRFV